MSTTTAIVRAAIAYVQPGPPSTLGQRHAALEETVTRYVKRKEQARDEDATEQEAEAAEGNLPQTTTRAFAKERGVRLLVRSNVQQRRRRLRKNG